MHSAAQMILSHITDIFSLFHNNQCLLLNYRRKNPEESNVENERVRVSIDTSGYAWDRPPMGTVF